MNIAEKVLQLKQDFDDVYAAGKAAGGGSGDYNQGYEGGKNSVPEWDRWIKKCTLNSLNMFKSSTVELNFDRWGDTSFLNFLNVNSLEFANTTVEHLIINTPVLVTSIQQMLYATKNEARDYTLKRVTLNFDTKNCQGYQNAFIMCRALEVIDGLPLNFSSVTTTLTSMLNGVASLIEFRVVPDTISVNFSVSSCPDLSAETIQSIFDGLATVDTAQTLTLHANLKILQSQVDSANAKGWTVAGGTVVSEEEYYG